MVQTALNYPDSPPDTVSQLNKCVMPEHDGFVIELKRMNYTLPGFFQKPRPYLIIIALLIIAPHPPCFTSTSPTASKT